MSQQVIAFKLSPSRGWNHGFIAKVSLVGGALAWGVLIASCTANSNFVSEFSETLRAPLPKPLARL